MPVTRGSVRCRGDAGEYDDRGGAGGKYDGNGNDDNDGHGIVISYITLAS